jgi:hypothetical protein
MRINSDPVSSRHEASSPMGKGSVRVVEGEVGTLAFTDARNVAYQLVRIIIATKPSAPFR